MRSTRLLLLLAVVCSILVAAPRTYAALCGESQPPCNPKKIGSPCYKPKKPCEKCKPTKCNKCTKSPGFVGIGAYEIEAMDLAIPTAGGFPLVASRRYDSTHQFDGALGYGWISSFEPRLFHAAYLFAAPDVYRHEVEVVLPDTQHFTFTDAAATGVFTPEAGRYDKLVKNADGTWHMTLQHTRSILRFDAQGLLTSVKDDYGNEQLWTYDAAGRLQRIADNAGSGRYLDVIWGADGRISHVVDHTLRQIAFTYDTRGVLTEVSNPLGQKTRYEYVPGRFAPLLSQIRDHWNRVITDVTWDSRDRVTSYTEEGEKFTYSYGAFSTTTKSNSSGTTWSYPYDADGLVTEDRLPGGAKRYTSYYSDGQIRQATDEAGVKTYYTYGGDGRVASVTRDYTGPTAVRFDYVYDPNFPERVISVLPKNPATGANDPNWQGWKYEYYQAGSVAPGALHKVMRVRSDGVTADLIATYAYNAKGRVLTVTDPSGAMTDSAYDAAGNLTSMTAPSNNDAGTRPVTTTAYDAFGRVTSVTDPLGATMTFAYDALDRRTAVTPPPPTAGSALGFTTTTAYDSFDPATALIATIATDPNGKTTRQEHDQFGRLRRSVDAVGNVTTYGYTRAVLSSITDANNNVTSYEYNVLGRLTATVFPDGARETYAYTPSGLLSSKTDRKLQTTSSEYDRHNRLVRKTYPNSAYVEYTYEGQKLTQVYDNFASPAETHTFTYDDRFRVTSNTQATRATVTYTHDVADRTASMSLSGGPATTYGYYPDGSLRSIDWSPVTGQFHYAYTPAGQYQTITFPNGQTRGYTYDNQGRLTQLANVHPTAGNLATFGYAYDVNHATDAATMLGQRVSMTATIPAQNLSAALTKYYYDANYQLGRADYPAAAPFGGEVHSWTYDAIGNRLTSTVNGATTNYTYQKVGTNPNNWQRMTSDGVKPYTYDPNGNTTAQGSDTFSWDYEDRMTSISGSATVAYTYDYQGRRTSKTVAGLTTTYVYDGANLVSETSGTRRDFVFGPAIDEPLALADATGAVSYYLVDALGSIAGAVGPTATPQNQYAYDAWGVTLAAAETAPQPFRNTAREAGDLVGHYFYRARYYQSTLGRFASEDPLSLLARAITRSRNSVAFDPSAADNPYAYVINNPTRYKDPTGWDAVGCDGIPWCAESGRTLNCCRQHDECYFRNKCTAQSWLTVWPSPCQQCNARVVCCFSGLCSAPPAPQDWVDLAREIDHPPAPPPPFRMPRFYGGPLGLR